MAITKIIKGNLIELFKKGKFEAIGHGANCRNLMGAGIAKQICEKLPEAYLADGDYYTRMGGSDAKPCHIIGGTISSATVQVGEKVARIINMYTQIQTGRNADYQLLHKACSALNTYCKGRSISRVGLPLIGAGIGGLDIAAVLTIINATTPDLDVTIVVFDKDERAWFEASKFNNYGFPRKFDGACIRTGQTTFAFRLIDDEKWTENFLDMQETKLIFENGEYALSYGDTNPSIWLMVKDDETFEENKSRLIA